MSKKVIFAMVIVFMASSLSFAGFGDLLNKAQKTVEKKAEQTISNIGKDDPVKILSETGYSNHHELDVLTKEIPDEKNLSKFEDQNLFQKIHQTYEALKQAQSDKLISRTSDQRSAIKSIESFRQAAVRYLNNRDSMLEKYHAQLEKKRLAAERKKASAVKKDVKDEPATIEKESHKENEGNNICVKALSCEELKEFPIRKINSLLDMSYYFGKNLIDWTEEDYNAYINTMMACRKVDDSFFGYCSKGYFPEVLEDSVDELKAVQRSLLHKNLLMGFEKRINPIEEKIDDSTVTQQEIDVLYQIKNEIKNVYANLRDDNKRSDYRDLNDRINTLLMFYEKAKAKQEAEERYNSLSIDPFGNLNWDDSLFEVFNKIKSINGLEKMVFYISKARKENGCLNMDESTFRDTLNTICKNEYQEKFTDPLWKQQLASKYIDKDGDPQYYVHNFEPIIKASPIVISNVPFTLIVEFEYSPGVAIESPSRVFKPKEVGITLPLFLSKVILSSVSPLLSSYRNTISEIIYSKYKSVDQGGWLKPRGSDLNIVGEARDKDNNRIYIDSNDDRMGYLIRYINGEKDRLENVYNEHLAELERSKLGNKQDMGSQL